jgi:hypothetical protein
MQMRLIDTTPSLLAALVCYMNHQLGPALTGHWS